MESNTIPAKAINQSYNGQVKAIVKSTESGIENVSDALNGIKKISNEISTVLPPAKTIASKIDQHTYNVEDINKAQPDSPNIENGKDLTATIENANASGPDFITATAATLMGPNNSEAPSNK